jgi:hypothetical protein
MPTVPDPLAVGVASALKSLRTRAGLREDRLSDTELALDTLTVLRSVRELIAIGEPPERAIVRAVRTAAGTLDPTLSIIADASLGLELFAGRVDPELYARDLGQRRTAVLKNWDRLHQLRSVPPPKPPSARALRLDKEADALAALAAALTSQDVPPGEGARPTATRAASEDHERPRASDHWQVPLADSPELHAFGAQLRQTFAARDLAAGDAAERVGVPESVISDWLDGRELPTEPAARALDDALTARGAILDLVLELRVPADQSASGGPSLGEPAGTLSEVFRQVAGALRGCLTRAEDGTPLGWPQDLRQLSGTSTVTSVSTAFGLKTLLLIEGDLAPDLVPVVERLRAIASERGYLDRNPANPRLEVTASVIDALHRVDGTEDFTDQIAMMRNHLSDFEKSRPFILTTMLESSLRLPGAEELTGLLTQSLLTARRPYGNRLLWPEKAEALLIDPAPSVAHTARAVRVLAQLNRADPDERLIDAIEQGVSWLLERNSFRNASDVVDRLIGDRIESVYNRHFTAAWAVKALVSAGVPATHPTVSGALGRLWYRYAGDAAALWKWDNGDLPIWMTFDAVEALRLASLAVPARPN